MPKKAGMKKWKKKRRQEYLEQKKYRYYIFCEGEATEPKYFQGFKKLIEQLRNTYNKVDMNIYNSTKNVNLNTIISYEKRNNIFFRIKFY